MSGVKGNFQVGDGLGIDEALGAVTTTSEPKQEQPKPQKQEVQETKEPVQQKSLDEVLEEQAQAKPKEEVDENVEKILGNNVETKPKEEEPKQETKQPEINDDVLLNYLNSKNNTSFKSLEEYQASLVQVQEKEVEKVVNPYEDLMDDTDKEYFEFKKNTGGSYNDYLNSKKDWDSVKDIDLARDRVRKENGLENLSDEDADLLIASSLGLDELDELEGIDKIKFQAYASKHRKELKQQQKELLSKKAPEKKAEPKNNTSNEEMVTLDNGQTIPKAQYDKLVQQRNEYLSRAKQAVDSIADFDFSFNVSENGETKTFNHKYSVSDEDRHSMMSIHENGLNVFIDKEFTDKDGNFNHEKLSRAMFFAKESNLQKVFKAVAEQVRAETVEELLGERNNVNFTGKKLKEKKGVSDLESKLLGGQQARTFGVRGQL